MTRTAPRQESVQLLVRANASEEEARLNLSADTAAPFAAPVATNIGADAQVLLFSRDAEIRANPDVVGEREVVVRPSTREGGLHIDVGVTEGRNHGKREGRRNLGAVRHVELHAGSQADRHFNDRRIGRINGGAVFRREAVASQVMDVHTNEVP